MSIEPFEIYIAILFQLSSNNTCEILQHRSVSLDIDHVAESSATSVFGG